MNSQDIRDCLSDTDIDRFKRFLKTAMPSANELTVFLTRNGYAGFNSFKKCFPDEFSGYSQYGNVIFISELCAWLNLHGSSQVNRVKVAVDTLLNGSTLKFYLDILDSFGFDHTRVSVYAYAVNDDIVDSTSGTYADPKTLFAVNTADGVLYSLDNPSVAYPFHSESVRSRMYLGRISRQLVELSHAMCVPYVEDLPSYTLSFEEAERVLYGGSVFPDSPDAFLQSSFLDSFDLYANTTFESGMCNGVYSVTAFAKTVYTDSDTPFMLRVYANFDSRIVTLVPCPVLCSCTLSDISELRSLFGIQPGLGESGLSKAEICKTLYTLIRYNRALRGVLALFGTSIDSYKSDNSVFERYSTCSLNDAQELLLRSSAVCGFNESVLYDIVQPSIVESLKSYEPPALFDYEKISHKQSLDLFCDSIRDAYRRVAEVPIEVYVSKLSNLIFNQEAKIPTGLSDCDLIKMSYAWLNVLHDRCVTTNCVVSSELSDGGFYVGQAVWVGNIGF